MVRHVVVALAILLTAAALAGCAGKNDEPEPTPTPTPDPTPTPTPTPPGNETPPEPARPADQTDSGNGAVQGPFEQSFTIKVPDARYQSVLVQFNLTPTQDGAPVTARVFVEFKDAAGASLKSATIGVGGAGNAIEYRFAPGELPMGDYSLVVTAEPPPQAGIPGVPSFGFANYAWYYLTDY